MFNCALILIKFICHTSRSQAVCSQINVIRPEQELKHHTLVSDRFIWISNCSGWATRLAKQIETFLMSTATVAHVSPPRLKDTEVKAKGRYLQFSSCSASSLGTVNHLKCFKSKKTYYWLLNLGSGVDQRFSFLAPPTPSSPHYLFCWKAMQGKASAHCVGERQSLTSLLAVQQCTLQQPVMCRLLPHICITIFHFFFFLHQSPHGMSKWQCPALIVPNSISKKWMLCV